MWLNEGIATVTVDRFLEKRTVRREALDLVKNYQPKGAPPTYRELSRASREAMAYHTVRGYWLVQYLEAKHPGLLKRLLTSPRESWAIENEIAKELGLEPAHLWSKIDDIMVTHLKS
jgi:hypothetical protein